MRNRSAIVGVLLSVVLACTVASTAQAAGTVPSAVARTEVIPGWQAVDPPTPAKAATDTVSGVGCTASSCVGIGSYTTASYGGGAMLDIDNGHSWTAIDTPPMPKNALGQSSALSSIACGSSECTVLGSYNLPTSIGLLLLTGSGTSWTSHQAPLPDPEWTYDHTGTLACATHGPLCVFSGLYEATVGGTAEGFLDVGSGGSWKADKAPLPKGADAKSPGVSFSGAACNGATCVVSGSYYDSLGNIQGLIETYGDGKWTAFKVAAPAQMPADDNVTLTGAACPTATSCMVIGSWPDADNAGHALVVTGLGSKWKNSSVKLPAGGLSGGLYTVTCPATKSCVATGYDDNSMMIAAWNGKKWSAVLIPVASNAVNDGNFYPAYNGNVACASAQVCMVVGGYEDKSGYTEPLLLTGSGLAWKAYNAPVPGNAVSHPDAYLSEVGCAAECAAFGSFTGKEQGAAFQGLPYLTGGVGTTCMPAAAPAAASAASASVPVSHDDEGNPWAGYIAKSSDCGFTQVTGQWIQPKISCPRTHAGNELDTDFWVGLDGGADGTDTVEQAGTSVVCTWDAKTKSYGVDYQAWYEMFPAGPVNLKLGQTAGSTVQATVTYGGQGKYTLKLVVTTKGHRDPFSITKRCKLSCPNSTAEWVIEKQSVEPMAPGGPWTVTGGYATTAADASWQSIQSLHPERSDIPGRGKALLGYPTALKGATMTVVYK